MSQKKKKHLKMKISKVFIDDDLISTQMKWESVEIIYPELFTIV